MPTNDLLIRALLRQPVERPPVWIMRQAGRYLPEYRALRAAHGSFMDFCRSPELTCQAALQPLARFPLDAAIVFSDILTIPDAMGLGLQFVPGEGPVFAEPVRTARAIWQLRLPDVEQDLGYVMAAVRQLKQALQGRLPVIGFAGSPWTLATYMVEGGSTRRFLRIKALMYEDPAALQQLLAVLTESVTAYLNAQIDAGADVVMLFDSWGGVLPEAEFRAFSLAPMADILAGLQRERAGQRIPQIIYARGCGAALPAIAASGCDAIGVDARVNLAQARQLVGDRVALQGNLDPALLFTSPDCVRRQVQQLVRDFGADTGLVVNLGEGIVPEAPIAQVEALVDAVVNLTTRLSPYIS